MDNISKEAFALSVLCVAIIIALLIFIKNILIKKVAYKDGKKKRNTLLGIIFNILQYVVIIVGIFAILTINGVNVTGLLAGLGVVATIVGLSLQDTFKDLFAGINIYSNNFYKVGDFVRYNGEVCEVKFFNARISKFSSISTNSTYTVSNSSITNIEKIKEGVIISFYFDFETDAKKIDKCLLAVTKAIEEEPGTKNVIYFGMDTIDDKGVRYCLTFSAAVMRQYSIKILAYKKAYEEFNKAKIAPSFNEDVVLKQLAKKKK